MTRYRRKAADADETQRGRHWARGTCHRPVVDVEFGRGSIPELFNCLTVPISLGELSKTLEPSRWPNTSATMSCARSPCSPLTVWYAAPK